MALFSKLENFRLPPDLLDDWLPNSNKHLFPSFRKVFISLGTKSSKNVNRLFSTLFENLYFKNACPEVKNKPFFFFFALLASWNKFPKQNRQEFAAANLLCLIL